MQLHIGALRNNNKRIILCNILGSWVDKGEWPADFKALEKIVKGICFENAKEYFNLALCQ